MTNEAAVPNLLNQDFDSHAPRTCVVSDLTYVRVGGQWAYICILLDLGTREIIGYSAGMHKNAQLVHSAFSTVKGNLFDMQMFHPGRGSEFFANESVSPLPKLRHYYDTMKDMCGFPR